MDLEFFPFTGTDRLVFGMTRDRVRNEVMPGIDCHTPIGEPETDMYRSEGLILGYDDDDELEFVEVIPPSSCNFRGINLFGDLDEVLSSLSALGHKAPMEDESYDFADIGVILYCPSRFIQSAAIYRDGYYDD